MRLTWNVAPRYTAGSPAMVNAVTAHRVAEQEEDAIKGYLDGFCGKAGQTMAQQLGLGGIVWSSQQRGRRVVTTDLITGEVHTNR